MNITIRQLVRDDVSSVRRLMHELGYPLDEDQLLFNCEMINQRNGIILVAAVDGAIVGCLSAMTNASLAEGLFGEIISLVVSAEYRRSGIGRNLVQQAEDWLKPQVKKIRIRSNSIRFEAHKFYQSMGYTEAQTQISFAKLI